MEKKGQILPTLRPEDFRIGNTNRKIVMSTFKTDQPCLFSFLKRCVQRMTKRDDQKALVLGIATVYSELVFSFDQGLPQVSEDTFGYCADLVEIDPDVFTTWCKKVQNENPYAEEVLVGILPTFRIDDCTISRPQPPLTMFVLTYMSLEFQIRTNLGL